MSLERRRMPTAHRWSVGEIVALLRAAHADLGGVLSHSAARAWATSRCCRFPSEHTIALQFGGWTAACEAAGVPPARAIGDARPGPAPMTTDECWEALGAFVQESDLHGASPTMERYQLWCREDGWPSRRTIQLRLGLGWQDAVERARRIASPDKRRRPVPATPARLVPVPTVAEMLEAMTAAAAGHGGRLSIVQYRAWAHREARPQPPPDAIRARFGSWPAACRAARIHAGRGGWPAIDVVAQLQRAYVMVGEPFTMTRFAGWAATQPSPICHLSAATAARALGSWSACQAAAAAGSRHR